MASDIHQEDQMVRIISLSAMSGAVKPSKLNDGVAYDQESLNSEEKAIAQDYKWRYGRKRLRRAVLKTAGKTS